MNASIRRPFLYLLFIASILRLATLALAGLALLPGFPIELLTRDTHSRTAEVLVEAALV